MYFIWDFTQLNVRPHSRVGLLKYKTAPKCSLSGPFRHSGVGRNPGAVGPVRSYNLNFTYPCQGLTGVCIGFHVGAWRVTSRSDLGSGQGSGSSHTRLQNRPRCSNHLSQAMPYRITLTVRPGFSRLLR